MLLTLLYHRVGPGKYSNMFEMLEQNFVHIAKRYPSVLPGDPLDKISVCLTFDDASYDFYHYVFPLLKKYNLRALLGVATHYILDTTKVSAEERLSVPYTMAMQDGFYDQKAPFCTWKEINEMVESGHVEVASHSHKHCNLTFPFVDLHREVLESKEILEANVPQAVSSFIYPFGKVNPRIHQYVSTHYPYTFRIGNGMNRSWHAKTPLLRVVADNMSSPTAIFSLGKRWQYRLKAFV
ncbi:MAG: polysaccharide deacetylase family protein [Chlamydiales bacterium]|nr:polysaccharide deacetylase family protein [Chlamydiales bacterium]